MKDKYADLPIEYKEAHFEKVREYREAQRREPVLKTLFLEMTLQCNQHCLHCGSNAGCQNQDRSLTDDELIDTMVNLKRRLKAEEKPLPFLAVTGGEPLLRSGMIRLMKCLRAMGYQWGMTSNGTLITREIAEELRDADMYSIGLSLDGLEESHNWFRVSRDGYRQALEAYHHLTVAGQQQVMFTTVVNKRNISELEDIYALMCRLNCRIWRVANVEPIGRALNNPDLMLDSEDYRYLLNFIATHQDNEDMSVIFGCNHYVGLQLERKIRPWYYSCRAGLNVASIQYNGDITACLDIERRPELVFGNVLKDDFYDVWLNGFDIFRHKKAPESEKCRECPHEDNCDGGGWHTWNFETHNPRICMMEELGIINKEFS